MELRPRLKVSSDRLKKPRIEPVNPGGERYIYYTPAAAPCVFINIEISIPKEYRM